MKKNNKTKLLNKKRTYNVGADQNEDDMAITFELPSGVHKFLMQTHEGLSVEEVLDFIQTSAGVASNSINSLNMEAFRFHRQSNIK